MRRTSAETAARAIAIRKRSARPGPRTGHPASETLALRELLLELAGRRPLSAAVLFDRVRDEWGEVSDRRLWRALRWLIDHGALARVGRVRHSDGYVLVQVIGASGTLGNVRAAGLPGQERAAA